MTVDPALQAWKLFELRNLSERWDPAISVLNSTEIVIMGGKSDRDKLNDIWVFNVRSDTCKKVAEGGPIGFRVWHNQSTPVGLNKVAVLVQ